MNVLVVFWQGEGEQDVAFFVGQVRQLLANMPRVKKKQVWLSVPDNCHDAAFLCHPWAAVDGSGILTLVDEIEEYYAVCAEGQVSIAIDSDDEEEEGSTERLVSASPIVVTGFSVDWSERPPRIEANVRTRLIEEMRRRKKVLLG
jgi:hypothetical protein